MIGIARGSIPGKAFINIKEMRYMHILTEDDIVDPNGDWIGYKDKEGNVYPLNKALLSFYRKCNYIP